MRPTLRLMSLASVLTIGGSLLADPPEASAQCGGCGMMCMGNMGMGGVGAGGNGSTGAMGGMSMNGMDMGRMAMNAGSPRSAPMAPAPAVGGPMPASAGARAGATEMTMARVTSADWKAIATQKTCPVSGQALGSMGAPVKLTYQGRSTFVCCTNCVASIWTDPGKYLAPSAATPATSAGSMNHTN